MADTLDHAGAAAFNRRNISRRREPHDIKRIDPVSYNKMAWNRQVEIGNPWTIGASPGEVASARAGQLNLYLTPAKPVPRSWFPPLDGCRVLCLASGGGQQGPLLAAAGAIVTVLDNSPRQLAVDIAIASREGLDIKTIEGDAADLSAIVDESFDLIVNPVSNCFMENILPVWREAARVLTFGGKLMAGFNNPAVYLFRQGETDENRAEADSPRSIHSGLRVVRKSPYSPWNEDANAETAAKLADRDPLEFGHSLQNQIGGQIASGLAIIGFYEDGNKTGQRRGLDDYMPLYIATLALKQPR